MVMDDVIRFLGGVAPFDLLDNTTLREVAAKVVTEHYPRNTIILRQDGPPSDHLRIILTGSVKVYVKVGDGEEVIIDQRRDGEPFGLISLMGGDKSRANVVATEDTVCYLLDRETVVGLIDSHPAFTEYFLKSVFNKFIDRTYHEIREKRILQDVGDQILYTSTLGEMISRPVVTAPRGISIRDAAQVMSRNNVSSLILTDGAGDLPRGIITDRDLRNRVVAAGLSVEAPIDAIMHTDLIESDPDELCFEGLLKMIRHRIHHLLVMEHGRVKGIVTNHDLMMLHGVSPLSLAKEIETHDTVEALVPLARNFQQVVGQLLREGTKATHIVRVITELNDRLLCRLLELTEASLGKPPVDFCWVVFGSEGRKEQTFKTDQDNAIIYQDPADEAEAGRALEYLTLFARRMNDALVACGFPPCPANYMASNPRWCQPISVWKEYFSRWINHPTPEAVLSSLIFFDFRPVGEETTLAEKLRAYLATLLRNQNIFLAGMASSILRNRPPLGFFGSFVVEKKGEHKDRLNIKEHGLGIIVDSVRLFALERGVTSTSTLERLQDVAEQSPLVEHYREEIADAFAFMMGLRLQHQYGLIREGKPPDNYIDPEELSSLEQKRLKDHFRFFSRLHAFIEEQYRAGMVGQG
jgi:CBS domain-containing protein